MIRAAANRANMATTRPAKITPRSARAWLPSQAYAVQDHHSSMKSTSPWAIDSADSDSAMNETTWVRAKTKTRSKKISKLVVRCASSVGTGRGRAKGSGGGGVLGQGGQRAPHVGQRDRGRIVEVGQPGLDPLAHQGRHAEPALVG